MAEWIECSIGDLCNTISDTYKGDDEHVVLVNIKAVVAIAAVWLCVSCTMSMSISKNNTNSNQSTEQSQATSVDSTTVDLNYK